MALLRETRTATLHSHRGSLAETWRFPSFRSSPLRPPRRRSPVVFVQSASRCVSWNRCSQNRRIFLNILEIPVAKNADLGLNAENWLKTNAYPHAISELN